ncbi:MAG: LOG family protein [Actinomycetota bacterium]
MATQVSVIGSGAEWESAADEVGRLLAERGCTVVTGGLGEVMAAAHRGAKTAGGTTIAILPGEDRSAANPWADHVVVTGSGHARNLFVAASGDAVIAVGGSYGTIAEMALALRLGRCVVALTGAPKVVGALQAESPAAAVELALRDLG